MISAVALQKTCLVAVLPAFFLGGCAGVPAKHSFAQEKTRSVAILLYHHIGDLPDTASPSQKRWTLSLKEFQRQMEWIAARGFRPVTMAQLVAHLKHGQPLPPSPIVLTFDDGWKEHYSEAFPVLKQYGFPATFFIITDSVGHSAYMNWEQVQEMSAAGMDMQSHSRTHQKLTDLPREDSRREIIESKKSLENRLNKTAVVFSYPYGSYNEAVIAMVKEAGFEAAASVSGLNGGYLFRKDQSYSLVRYAIEGDTVLEELAGLKSLNH